MFHLVNRHSFVLTAIVVLAAVAMITRRWSGWARVAAVLGAAGLLVVPFVTLRTGTGDVRTAGDLEVALAKGRPVALEWFSNY